MELLAGTNLESFKGLYETKLGHKLHSVRICTIQSHLREKKLSSKEWLCLSIQLCNAVAYMHTKGILNNDVKCADNIIITGERGKGYAIKICDFGKATHNSKPLKYNICKNPSLQSE